MPRAWQDSGKCLIKSNDTERRCTYFGGYIAFDFLPLIRHKVFRDFEASFLSTSFEKVAFRFTNTISWLTIQRLFYALCIKIVRKTMHLAKIDEFVLKFGLGRVIIYL